MQKSAISGLSNKEWIYIYLYIHFPVLSSRTSKDDLLLGCEDRSRSTTLMIPNSCAEGSAFKFRYQCLNSVKCLLMYQQEHSRRKLKYLQDLFQNIWRRQVLLIIPTFHSLPLPLCWSGSGSAPTPEVLNCTKNRPSPPPGLSPPDEGRTGLKGTESRPLEKVFVTVYESFLKDKPQTKTKLSTGCLPLLQILENEDLSGQSEDESSQVAVMSSSEVCDAVSRFSLTGRRGSLQGPEVAKVFIQGRRHSTGQALTYRWAFTDNKHFIKVRF